MTFRAKLVRPPGVGTWTFAEVPSIVVARAGLRPRQRVKGTIDGAPFSSTLLPRGGGTLFVVVNETVRTEIRKTAGHTVGFALELDASPVVVPVPPALASALRKDAAARKVFEGLAPSHRKAYALWVASAKQAETVERRVAKALAMLRKGQTLN